MKRMTGPRQAMTAVVMTSELASAKRVQFLAGAGTSQITPLVPPRDRPGRIAVPAYC